MPKFKEVVPLQTMAMDLFIESVTQCCDRLSEAKDRKLFRVGVIAIRTEVNRYLPGPLLAEFGNRFFEKLRLRSYDRLDYNVGLEIIMDIKIVGLRLKGVNMQELDLREGHRFPGLGELDFSYVVLERLYRYLPDFNTNFLTKFVHHTWCTDDDLAIIGQQCQNLKVLRINESNCLTDEGLRALSRCSNLRCVHFRRCAQVSHLGLNHLLSAHKKLEDFYYEPNDISEELNFGPNIDASSGLDLSVTVLSLKSLTIRISRKASAALNLAVIVKKFPNLINLEINCPDALNLSALKLMNSLTMLKVYFLRKISNEKLQQTWGHIEEILSCIGPNITTLTLWALLRRFSCQQEHLNLIYNRCPNLEHLAFDHGDGMLVVPEFKKLRALTPRTPSCTLSVCNLEFGTMLNLEILSLPYLGETINLQTITGMMFDDRFPKLSVLRLRKWSVSQTRRSMISDFEEIERKVKDNNLDFQVVDLDDHTFVCDYFTNFPDNDFYHHSDNYYSEFDLEFD